MAKSKKTPPPKKSAKAKNNIAGEKRAAYRSAMKPKKQAKPNLQPARIIKRPEPEAGPAVQPLTESASEELQASKNSVVSTSPLQSLQEESEATGGEAAEPAVAETEVPMLEEAKVVEAKPVEPSARPKGKSPASPVQPAGKKTKRRRRLKRSVFSLLAIGLIGAAGYYLVYMREAPDIRAENERLIVEVSEKVAVPTTEKPAITTVVDEKKINQEFLRGTKKGDKVLLYFQTGKAIVYRPETGQIINIGPIETPTPKVFLRNGSTSQHVEAVTEKLSASAEFVIASQDESSKKDYQKTIVVDVGGVRPDMAKRLAGTINASVGKLPEGESAPDADLLVIVGSDQTNP
jgi:hypothetical protein